MASDGSDADAPSALRIHAHSVPGRPEAEWEELSAHLRLVGEIARRLAAKFGAGDMAAAAGLLHDIGKVSAAFQRYIRSAGDEGRGPDNSTAGAIVADALFADGPERAAGRLAAMAIAGHHGGLGDGGRFAARLAKPDLPDYRGWADLALPLPASLFPRLPRLARDTLGYQFGFLGRMVFSCLVDADFIATERFYDEADGRPATARGGHASLTVLRERLDRRLARFAGATGALAEARAAILAHARAQAGHAPGLFTMTVPTGGGKTLAGLAFALDHAIAHGLDRVIVVAPYAAIIEQTAQTYRDALGDDDVLEHTGTVDWDAREKESDDDGARDAQAKLRRATENWDVPVVVTTAGQFFESLHANRTSRCRRLHNIARASASSSRSATASSSAARIRRSVRVGRESAAARSTKAKLCFTVISIGSRASPSSIPAAVCAGYP